MGIDSVIFTIHIVYLLTELALRVRRHRGWTTISVGWKYRDAVRTTRMARSAQAMVCEYIYA